MDHEDPNIHLQSDDDLWFEHSRSCRCSLCHPELLHPPDLWFIRQLPSWDGKALEIHDADH